MSQIVYLRDLDGTGSLHACSKGDPGAIAHGPFDIADKLAEALEFMIIEQGREGFGDEMDDIKRGNEALATYRKAKGE